MCVCVGVKKREKGEKKNAQKQMSNKKTEILSESYVLVVSECASFKTRVRTKTRIEKKRKKNGSNKWKCIAVRK